MRTSRPIMGTGLLVCIMLLSLGPSAFAGSVTHETTRKSERSATQTSDFYDMTGVVMAGWSSLGVRSHDMVKYQIKAADLLPGHLYSIAFLGWNDPSLCEFGPGTCGFGEGEFEQGFPGSFAQLSSIWVQRDTTSANIEDNVKLSDPGANYWGSFTSPEHAEIQLLVRDHGLPEAGKSNLDQVLEDPEGCDEFDPGHPDEPCDVEDIGFNVFAGR